MRAIAKPHTHKIGLISGKNQGNLPPPPGPQKSRNIRWFNRETPEIREKSGKNQEKMGSSGGGGVGGMSVWVNKANELFILYFLK